MASTAALHQNDVAPPGGARALVVEDNDALRTSLCELLRSDGYEVSAASDGREALTVAARERPEVVILDVHLPVLHGYEVCRRLRGTHGYALAIVFLSGSRTEPYDRIAGLDAGGDDYIVKPFDPGELLARIGAQVRRLRSTRIVEESVRSPLTARQEQIVWRLAQGEGVAEIAAELVISPATVRKHIERIHRTLGVRNRAELVSWAHAFGLAQRIP